MAELDDLAREEYGEDLARLSKDYEYRVESSEAFIYLGMSVHMLRRLAAHQPAGST